MTLETEADVAGTQNDIAFNPSARIAADGDDPRCTVNAAIDKDATTFAFLPAGCTPGDDCTSVRALILAFANLDPIPSGSTLYTCEVEIAEDATGSYPLTCSEPGAGDPDGTRLGADCTDGTITVAEPGTATIVVDDVVGARGDFVPVEVSLQTALRSRRGWGTTSPSNRRRPWPRMTTAIRSARSIPRSTRAGRHSPSCPPAARWAVRAPACALGSSVSLHRIRFRTAPTLYTCTIAIAEDARRWDLSAHLLEPRGASAGRFRRRRQLRRRVGGRRRTADGDEHTIADRFACRRRRR